MTAGADSINMALFCDFENVALGVRDAKYDKFDIRPVLERLLLKGSIVVKKAYCDWERYKSFKATMHEANFELIEIPHLRQSGKNSADIRLVVDALDLCYTKSHVDTFVIISGDSDFSPLVSKLRENAKQVIGVGVKQSTSDLLIANCDEFIFYDDLVRDRQRAARRDAREPAVADKRPAEDENQNREDQERRRSEAIQFAVETLDDLIAERGDGGKIWASMLKQAIKRRKPHFNESYFGFRAFGNLLDEAQARGLLNVGRDEKSGTYVQRAAATADNGNGNGNVPMLPTPRSASAVSGELAPKAVMSGSQSGTAVANGLSLVAVAAESVPVDSPALVAKGGPRRSARKPAAQTMQAVTAAAGLEQESVLPAADLLPSPETVPVLASVPPVKTDAAASPDRAKAAGKTKSKVAAKSTATPATKSTTKLTTTSATKSASKAATAAANKTVDSDVGEPSIKTATKKTAEPAAEKKAEPAKTARPAASKAAGTSGRGRAMATKTAAQTAMQQTPESAVAPAVEAAAQQATGTSPDLEQP